MAENGGSTPHKFSKCCLLPVCPAQFIGGMHVLVAKTMAAAAPQSQATSDSAVKCAEACSPQIWRAFDSSQVCIICHCGVSTSIQRYQVLCRLVLFRSTVPNKGLMFIQCYM
jgi:hypothetical protein